MKPFLVRTFQGLFFLALAGFLLFLSFRGVDAEGFLQEMMAARYPWVLLSMVFALGSFFFRGYRWLMLVDSLGYKGRGMNAYHAVILGYTANFAFPRLGEVFRCAVLNKLDGIPVDRLLGTVIVERLFDVLMLGLITLGFMALEPEMLLRFLPGLAGHLEVPDQGFIGKVLVGIALALFLLVVAWLMFKRIFPRTRFSRRVSLLFRGIYSGLRSAWKMKQRVPFLLATAGIWSCYFMMTYTLFLALDTTSGLGFPQAMFVLVIASFAFVVPAQGGIGSYHLVVSLGLTLFGISREDGLLYATLSHGSQTLFTLLLGVISFYVFIRNKRKLRNV